MQTPSTEEELILLNLPVTFTQLGSAREVDIDALISEQQLSSQQRFALVDIWKRHPIQLHSQQQSIIYSIIV